MSVFQGKRVLLFPTEKAFNEGFNWPSFIVIHETILGLYCKGVNSPDGSKHDGSEVWIPTEDILNIIEWKP